MSRLLLDTHAFLWWVGDRPELSAAARAAIADESAQPLLSVASAWELAIKCSLGKLRLVHPVQRFVTEQVAANGFRLLPVELAHAARVETLPWHHKDPFDRLLIAQALEERVPLVSADAAFDAYGIARIW